MLTRLLGVLLALCLAGQAGAAEPLRRGINITNWFRFPVSRDPAFLAHYISDAALSDLRAVGFDFVRLAFDPDITDPAVLIPAIQRIQRHGLTVIVSPHPNGWELETQPGRLRMFWRRFAPVIGRLDPALTVAEIVNEPVFPHDPASWAALQHSVLTEIRHALPSMTVLLTGQDWGSIGGLEALTPEDDPNVIYSFHFYDPPELTSLAAYRHNVDRTALARLPFPAAGCPPSPGAAEPTAGLFRYYCASGWDAVRIDAAIARAAARGAAHHIRLLAGEFGATAELNRTARLAWLTATRQAMEAHGIPWALWGYDDIMGFALSRPPPFRPRLDDGVIQALGLATRM